MTYHSKVRYYGDMWKNVLAISFLAMLLLASSWVAFSGQLNSLQVIDQPAGAQLRVDKVNLVSGGYLVVSRLDPYGLARDEGNYVVSDYLLPGEYQNIYLPLADLYTSTDQSQDWGVQVSLIRETHSLAETVLFFGTSDEPARTWWGAPITKHVRWE